MRCCALLCAAVRCCALLCAEKASAPCKLVQNTSNRAGSASANGESVRCMDAAWRGADGSSTQQPRLSDCRRSSTCSDGFTTNVACRRSFRCSALHHTNLLRRLLRHVRDERSLPPRHSLLCAALRCSALHHTSLLRKLLRHARLVQHTSNRASSASINETSVRCMEAAWRGVECSSTKQPRLYDCRRSFHVARAAAKTVARQHVR